MRACAVILAVVALALNAQSQARGSAAPFSVTPRTLPRVDGNRTVVVLDARRSLGRAVEAGLDGNADVGVRWIAPGATFVQGTNDRSPVARVTYPGGANYPVRLVVTGSWGATSASAAVAVTGEPIRTRGTHGVWEPLEVLIEGPQASETDDDPNPFLDYRLNVTFTGPAQQTYVVPGFYDGDGLGGSTGNVWKARFTPDQAGAWSYSVSFRSGPDVAVSLDPQAGSPVAYVSLSGRTFVLEPDPEACGFYRRGRLSYVGSHYLQFADGSYFLKGGTGSPENLFGYRGFDDIQDNGNGGIIHEFPSHVADFEPGGPLFASNTTSYDSRGLIGALDYLASQNVNSVFFLPMNLGGDTQDTTPFGYVNDAYDKTHYDVSRLAQWNRVMIHAQRKGILIHMALAETELANEEWLDSGELGVERKLFYREMVARFGHLLALKWNLSEENDYSVQHLRDFGGYLAAQDPYDHPIGMGTHSNNFTTYEQIQNEAPFCMTSVQYPPNSAGANVEYLRDLSATAGRPWVIDMDENTHAVSDSNAADVRRKVLYDVYFSGGELEWYAGAYPLPLGGDLDLEDFRTREAMWEYTWTARQFMEEHLPFWEMEPSDELLIGETETGTYGAGEVFAKPDEVYAVYLPICPTTGNLDLTAATGTFQGRWFNPRNGTFEGATQAITAGGMHPLGPVPADSALDWVFLVSR